MDIQGNPQHGQGGGPPPGPPAGPSGPGSPGDDPVLETLEQTLAVAGLRPGERFEVAAKSSAGMVAATFGPLPMAAKWLRSRLGGDLYLGLNPITQDAAPPHGRVRNEDVALVRALLVDVDPADASDEARGVAWRVAADARALLCERLGVLPPLVDSGRGYQLLLRHEPAAADDDEVRSVRRRLLRALGATLDRPGAAIDVGVANASRLARLPLGRNGKTGRSPALAHHGDDRVASLEAMRRLAETLEAEARPAASPAPEATTAGSEQASSAQDARLDELRRLIQALPATPETYRWFGAQAERVRVAPQARGVVPPERHEVYDQGVDMARAGGSLPRPVQNETLVRRIVRGLERLALPDDPAAGAAGGGVLLQVLRVVHYRRPSALGGTFDLEVATQAGAAVVRGLTGRDLLRYRRVAARAAESGLLLPHLPTKDNCDDEAWHRLLRPAFERAQVVDLPDAAEAEAVIEDAIRDFLGTAPRGVGVAELDRGHLWEAGSEALVATQALVRAVRQALADERPTRAEILNVAAAHGATVSRERSLTDADGRRVRRSVVSFPLATGQEG